MNTYDAAYDLARAIKDSDEMKRLTAAAEVIKGDEEAKKNGERIHHGPDES